MPEVILPCPACGSDVKISGGDEWHNQHSFFIECQCGVCRVGDTVRAECIDRWNALPRALTWTNEPPKVAGWYWMRQQGEIFDLIQHYNQADIDGGFDNERRLKQWSGPIPEPKEPT